MPLARPAVDPDAARFALRSHFALFSNTVRAANLDRRVFKEMGWDLSKITQVEDAHVRVRDHRRGHVDDHRINVSLTWESEAKNAAPCLLITCKPPNQRREFICVELDEADWFANFVFPDDDAPMVGALNACLEKLAAHLEQAVELEGKP